MSDNLIIGLVLVVCVICCIVCFVWSPFGDLFAALGNLFGGGAKLLSSGTKAIGTGATVIANTINPATYSKSASFCCDIFTKNQLTQLIQRDCLKCRDCKRYTTPSNKCFFKDADFAKVLSGCTGKLSADSDVNPPLLGCDGTLTSVKAK
jgi:hypothetical protein